MKKRTNLLDIDQLFFFKILGVAIVSEDDGNNDDDEADGESTDNSDHDNVDMLSKEKMVVFIHNRDGNQNIIMTMARAAF